MGEKPETITARVTVKLRPWEAPTSVELADKLDEFVLVQDLDPDALEHLALAWVRDLFANAGRDFSADRARETIASFFETGAPEQTAKPAPTEGVGETPHPEGGQ